MANILTVQPIVHGVVVEGKKLGRELGYPTANIRINEGSPPESGIYAVLVQIGEGREATWHKAAASYGINPTFEFSGLKLEVHILNFNEDIYYKTIIVKFMALLRMEQQFSAVEDMIAQIDKDCEAANAILNELEREENNAAAYA